MRILLLPLILVSAGAFAGGNPVHSLTDEARTIAGQFAGTLKPALLKTIEQEGAPAAIEVCADIAPAIARDLSRDTGWSVTRVSLRPRNTISATTSNWQKTVLEGFEQQLAAGVAPQNLEHSEQVEGEFRFMKAQVTEPLCLMCHGTQIAEPIQAAITNRYPDDNATGYQAGQVRGAISLTKALPSR